MLIEENPAAIEEMKLMLPEREIVFGSDESCDFATDIKPSARERGIRMIAAGKETAAEAAQVIQQYWNNMRVRATGEEIPEAVGSSES